MVEKLYSTTLWKCNNQGLNYLEKGTYYDLLQYVLLAAEQFFSHQCNITKVVFSKSSAIIGNNFPDYYATQIYYNNNIGSTAAWL